MCIPLYRVRRINAFGEFARQTDTATVRRWILKTRHRPFYISFGYTRCGSSTMYIWLFPGVSLITLYSTMHPKWRRVIASRPRKNLTK